MKSTNWYQIWLLWPRIKVTCVSKTYIANCVFRILVRGKHNMVARLVDTLKRSWTQCVLCVWCVFKKNNEHNFFFFSILHLVWVVWAFPLLVYFTVIPHRFVRKAHWHFRTPAHLCQPSPQKVIDVMAVRCYSGTPDQRSIPF